MTNVPNATPMAAMRAMHLFFFDEGDEDGMRVDAAATFAIDEWIRFVYRRSLAANNEYRV